MTHATSLHRIIGQATAVTATVDFRALEIEIPGKSTCRFLNDLVEFRNRAANVPIDFYRPISKATSLTVREPRGNFCAPLLTLQ